MGALGCDVEIAKRAQASEVGGVTRTGGAAFGGVVEERLNVVDRLPGGFCQDGGRRSRP